MSTIDHRSIRSAMIAMVLTSTVLSATPVALADTAPRSATASADVYKMLADDKGLRVLVATWKPGQRDLWHSHPVMGVYWLTDCDARVYSLMAKDVEVSLKAGQAGDKRSLPLPAGNAGETRFLQAFGGPPLTLCDTLILIGLHD